MARTPRMHDDPAPEDTEIVAPPKTFEEAKTELQAARQSLIDHMKAHFKTQRRVRVKVRSDGDVPVQINGYTFVIQANVPVDVPEDVARLLEEADYI